MARASVILIEKKPNNVHRYRALREELLAWRKQKDEFERRGIPNSEQAAATFARAIVSQHTQTAEKEFRAAERREKVVNISIAATVAVTLTTAALFLFKVIPRTPVWALAAIAALLYSGDVIEDAARGVKGTTKETRELWDEAKKAAGQG